MVLAGHGRRVATGAWCARRNEDEMLVSGTVKINGYQVVAMVPDLHDTEAGVPSRLAIAAVDERGAAISAWVNSLADGEWDLGQYFWALDAAGNTQCAIRSMLNRAGWPGGAS